MADMSNLTAMHVPVATLGTMLAPAHRDDTRSIVERSLEAVRSHLGLQVAYISEFVGNEAVFRHVDAPGLDHLAKVGDRHCLDDVYCRHILEGRLPELMPDTADYPIAAAIPVTAAIPIGAHVSVPLRLRDGHVYGMFCCLGPAADKSLNDRDLAMMRAFAEIASFEIDRDVQSSRVDQERAARINRVIADDSLSIVYQPIFNIASGRPIGFESLARFDAEPRRTPDLWFAEAGEVGLGVELELLAIARALSGLASIPAPLYLAVNASPDTVVDGALTRLLRRFPLDRVVLEITEHNCVEDFAAIAAVLKPLRRKGLRLAVDDCGAGYSGLQQILQTKPDLIKLDRSLIQDIGTDPAKRALAAALTAFARETDSGIVAEGVETASELDMLRALGVGSVQGYFLGRPETIDGVHALLARTDRRKAAA